MLNEAPASEVSPADEPGCVACGCGGSASVLQKGDLEVVRCVACGHVYLESWREELARFDELYGYFHDRKGALDLRMSPINERRLAELLRELGACAGGRRLLDVGAGEGKLVYAANRLGWDARGIDLAEHAVASCRAAGLPIEKLDFFDSRLTGERFDVISMCELLEHVPGPARFLSRAEQLLAPGGVLYLTTPNFDALSRRALGAEWRVIHPQHISYFTEPYLRRMVIERTRLEILSLDTRNVSLGSLALAARRRVWRVAPPAAPRSAPVSHDAARAWSVDQRVRGLAQTRPGAALKRWTNSAVAAARLGDTIVAILRRRASEPS